MKRWSSQLYAQSYVNDQTSFTTRFGSEPRKLNVLINTLMLQNVLGEASSHGESLRSTNSSALLS